MYSGQYFQYPIETSTLIIKKKRIKKQLAEQIRQPVRKKIAILGGSTTNEIADQLELFLLANGIEPEIYQSEYNQFWQDAIFGNPLLDQFSPDVIYIHTNWRNISSFPELTDTKETIDGKLASVCAHYEAAWTALRERYACPIIQNNFERPNYRLLGNRDIWDPRARSNFINCLNRYFYDYAAAHDDFYINDIDYLAADYGLSKWNDAFCWHMYKYAMNLDAVPILAKSVADIIKSLFGRNKKVLVLDLDNTLWGGVIGDDGISGIAVGQEIPEGQAYTEFQSYCKALKSLGVVLAVNSKNEEQAALEGLNHPDGVLKPSDFVAIKANWKQKDVNIQDIALDLNLGLDSMVFVDDNPAEQELVRRQLPDVTVPVISEVEHSIEILDHSGYFETTTMSEEDLRKTELYLENRNRNQCMQAYADYNDYLADLQMEADIRMFQPVAVPRIAQLTNKTNQFNLTTLRCTDDDIRRMGDSDNYITLQGKLKDKFGDNGIVSVVAGEILERDLHMRLWLMSCRVLKRGMENAMMDRIVSIAREKGLKRIFGYYYPTVKNAMVKDFYEGYGFKKCIDTDDADPIWKLDINEYTPKEFFISLNDAEE